MRSLTDFHILNRQGCVAKNMLGHKNTERHFSSGGNIEEIGYESNWFWRQPDHYG
jgi:hypothetical protein